MMRFISVLFSLLLIFATVTSAGAVYYECPVDPVSDAVYMIELNTNTVVYSHNAEEIVYPASTTKIMTYIIVAESVPDFDSTKIKITADALADLDPESSVMGLESHIGESFSVRDLLYGLMLPSGNDAALVLADYVGQGVDGFVDLMNRKAAQIGCHNTHFTSPHGLHDSQHYTTAKDLAMIAKYAVNKKDFMEICGSVSYTPEGFSEALRTTNYLIDASQKGGAYYYPYATGIKTGFTDEAGRCLVSSADNGEYTYLCVALGADYSYVDDINYAMLDSADLYDWAFENLSAQTVFDSTDVLTRISVEYVWGNKMLDLVPEKQVEALLPNDYQSFMITTKVECDDLATAPVHKGDVYGTLTVYYDDEYIGETKVVAAEDIERQYTNYLAHQVIRWIRGHVIISIIIFIAILLVILIIIDRIRMRSALKQRRNARSQK